MSTPTQAPLSEAFVKIVALAEAWGDTPIAGAMWTAVFGPWKVTVNGTDGERDGIPRFCAKVEYNGRPAGVLDPFGGVMVADEVANEAALIEALDAALPEAMLDALQLNVEAES